jgi:hypothetical protein
MEWMGLITYHQVALTDKEEVVERVVVVVDFYRTVLLV